MITIKDIRDLAPCYDPGKYLKDNWAGTIQDILRMSNISPEDRLWVACHKAFINKNLLFKFAENCCWQIVSEIPEDEQLEYCNILCILRLARESSDNELRAAACDASWAASWDAARYAARYAARDAAWNAAWDAAWDAARNAAWDAARYAARYAARDEFCLMLADMVDGKEIGLDDMYLMDRLSRLQS